MSAGAGDLAWSGRRGTVGEYNSGEITEEMEETEKGAHA